MSQKLLRHRGYQGTVEVDFDKGCLYGKVLFIKSLITYAGATPDELKASFEQEVDEYIADCEALNVEPEKPFSGTFQIRCSAELHKELSSEALNSGVSFNKYVVALLEQGTREQ